MRARPRPVVQREGGWARSISPQAKQLRGRMVADLSSCAACGCASAPHRCGKCKGRKYCFKECQRSDWKSHRGACRDHPQLSSRVSPGGSHQRHFGLWCCKLCGGECTCLQQGGHSQSCHHYVNTLRRKGPDCFGGGKCAWLYCCDSPVFDSYCAATDDGTRRTYSFVHPEKVMGSR